MCAVKTPKITAEEKAQPKPVVIRNPYLDGVDPAMKAARAGRSALRINRSPMPARIPVGA